MVINVHYLYQLFIPRKYQGKTINIIHGSEILMTSANPLKKLFKKVFRSIIFRKIGKTDHNVFISDATLQKARSLGHYTDYSRDLIFHNCIDSRFKNKKVSNIEDDQLIFTAVARDVPHKNIKGAVEFCENIKRISKKKVTLYLSHKMSYQSELIDIEYLDGTMEEIDNAYRKAHLNLLLSLDHSHRGFYEGFGLVVLEAALQGTPTIAFPTGGIPESVHNNYTGWLIDNSGIFAAENLYKKLSKDLYNTIAENAYTHTIDSHGLDIFRSLMRALVGKSAEKDEQ